MRAIKYAFTGLLLAAGMTSAMAQNGDEIISKHIDAIGGEANWAKITSMKMVGTMKVQGMELGMTQTTVHNKAMRTDISVMGSEGYMIATTTEGWMYMPMQGVSKATPIPAEQLKMMKDKLSVRANMLADKSTIAKAELLGKDTVNKVPCYKVKVTDKDGNMQTAYFDASTYYMVRVEAKASPDAGDQEVNIDFSNFQKTPEGVVLAMTMGSPQGDITFKTVELNKPIDEKIFKPTQEEMEGKK